MSCPGPLDLIEGKILTTPNLHGKWHGLCITKELENLIHKPVYLEMMQILQFCRSYNWGRKRV